MMKNRANAIEALMSALALRLGLGSASIYASPYRVIFIRRRHENRLRGNRVGGFYPPLTPRSVPFMALRGFNFSVMQMVSNPDS